MVVVVKRKVADVTKKLKRNDLTNEDKATNCAIKIKEPFIELRVTSLYGWSVYWYWLLTIRVR